MTAGVAYEVRGLTKTYPRQGLPATCGVDLTLHQGEIFGVLGDNGAGKSTLVQLMIGLLRPDAGTVLCFGRDVQRDQPFVAMQTGYMPQSAFALNHLKVREAIFFSAHLRGMDRAAARAHRDELVEMWGLHAVAGRVSKQLSGGQRRLLQLAVAMAGRPPVLVLDEPTNDLDPQRRRLVWQTLRELNRDCGTTIMFITHDAVEAEKAIDRVGIMSRGRLVALGRPAELKSTVDRKLRLELVFPPGAHPALPEGPAWSRLDSYRWLGYLDAGQVEQVMGRLDLAAFDDVRLHAATLEDLYLRYADAP